MTNARIAFITNSIDSITPQGTTWMLMQAAQEREFQIFWMEPSDLHLHHDKPVGYMTAVSINDGAITPGESILASLADLNVVWWRCPPPHDFDQLFALDLLEMLAPQTLVFNHPPASRSVHTHLAAVKYPNLLPPSLTTKKVAAIEAFLSEVGGAALIRPLHQPSLQKTFLLGEGDPNLPSLLQLLTQNETEYTYVQQYIAEEGVHGVKRLFLINGELLGIALQEPPNGEFRGSFETGATAVATQASAKDLAIVETLAPSLKEQGIFLASIDVSDGFIVDMNLSCVEGLEKLQGVVEQDVLGPIFQHIGQAIAWK